MRSSTARRVLSLSHDASACASCKPKQLIAVFKYLHSTIGEIAAGPMTAVRKCFDLLRPDGQAVIRVTRTEPLFPLQRLLRRSLMYAPMHLNDFSPRTMERLGRDLGFRAVEVRVGRVRRSQLMDSWIRAIRDQGGASNIIIVNGLDWGYSFGPEYGPLADPDTHLPWKSVRDMATRTKHEMRSNERMSLSWFG